MKSKILDMLRTAGGYISGEKISNSLNISRTAVWKHINALRKDGFDLRHTFFPLRLLIFLLLGKE